MAGPAGLLGLLVFDLVGVEPVDAEAAVRGAPGLVGIDGSDVPADCELSGGTVIAGVGSDVGGGAVEMGVRAG